MKNRNIQCAIVTIAMVTTVSAAPSPVLRVVHEPWRVSTCSTKSEHAWTRCKWCDCKIGYERVCKWDVYEREWVETTAEIPALCRKCKAKEKYQEKLAREEAKLDRKLAERETKARIAAKRHLLSQRNCQGGDM